MKSLWLKLGKSILSVHHMDVYFLAGLNALLTLAMLMGRNKFFHAVFVPICLAMTVAALLTILIEKISFKTLTRAESKNIIIAAAVEAFLLFSFSFLWPATLNVIILVAATLLMQSVATLFFWKAFQTELEEVIIFSIITGKILTRKASRQLSYFKSKTERIKFTRTLNAIRR